MAELATFCVFVVIGIVIGALYFVAHIIEIKAKTKRLTVIIGCVLDIVFCCAVFLIVYSSILTLCYGECRPYIFFAICLGLLIYIKIVRLPLDKVKLKLYNLIYKGRKNNESNLRK